MGVHRLLRDEEAGVDDGPDLGDAADEVGVLPGAHLRVKADGRGGRGEGRGRGGRDRGAAHDHSGEAQAVGLAEDIGRMLQRRGAERFGRAALFARAVGHDLKATGKDERGAGALAHSEGLAHTRQQHVVGVQEHKPIGGRVLHTRVAGDGDAGVGLA